MERICKNCIYWECDKGIFTAMGWTGMDRDEGYCHYEPKTIYKEGNQIACSKFEEKK